jgi:Fur family ferric uptake transcriptional regulator
MAEIQENKIQKILKKHKLRKTACRMTMLKLFWENQFALTPSGIEAMLNNFFDKVTIYRTLSTFEECGIVHKVPNDNGITHYALCHSNCSHEKHSDSHVHFYCQLCSKTFCLHEIRSPELTLPKGYQVKDFRYLFLGICPNCQNL